MAEAKAIKRGPRFKDRTNERVGRLTILRLDRMEKRGRIWKSFWCCRCDCGTECVLPGANFSSGNTKSCGCLRREAGLTKNLRHGRSYTRAYNIWQLLIRRCTDPNNESFADYGGRGITICNRWLECFENFYADMGDPPTGRHSIDREDNNGGYSKGNCRWATAKQQSRNSRRNVHVEYQGHRRCISEWAEVLGLKMHTLYARLFVYRWDVHRSFTTPVRKR